MKKTILVVEDEMEVAHAVEAILEDEGYEVLLAGDGNEALGMLNDKVPDLILSDVMMPYCSGPELLRKIRNNDSFKAIPLIFMSAGQVSQPELKQEEFLKKPFDIDSLIEVVEKKINKAQAN